MNKQQVRKIYKSKRLSLSKQEIQEKSHAIFEQFQSSPWVSCTHWNCFLPIKKWNEVNTYPIIELGLSLNKVVAVPKVKGDELLNCQIQKQTKLVISKWDIPEPEECEEVATEQFDLILTPLLGCDTFGNRVGYGKGFYDRLFNQANPNALKIGLSFFDPINKISDIDHNDIPLKALITPHKIFTF